MASGELAREFEVTIEAVREALDYAANNMPTIEADREREAASLRARGPIDPDER